MSKKMNLNFLLSPSKDDNNDSRNREGRPSRNSTTSGFDLDFISPSSTGQIPTSSSRSLVRQSFRPGHPHYDHAQSSSMGHLGRSQQQVLREYPVLPRQPQRPGSSKDKYSPSQFVGVGSTESRPHVCPSCGRGFYKLEQLKRHDRLVHKNLRPFVCTTCDLSFGTKQNMQVHLTTRKHQQKLESLQRSEGGGRGESSK